MERPRAQFELIPFPRRSIRAALPALSTVVALASSASPPARPLILGSSVRDTVPAFRNPTGIAVDAAGVVYVASAADSSIVIYAPGAKGRATPARRIGPRSGLVSPQALALDSDGRIVVSSGQHRAEGKGSITVYAPGASGDAAPVRVFAGTHTGLSEPTGLTLGPRGRLFVVNGPRANVFNSNGVEQGVGTGVLVFNSMAAGDVPPDRTLLDIIDTIVRAPPPSRPPAAVRTIDTVCGKPPPSGGSVVCATFDHVEALQSFLSRTPFEGTPPQRPDTLRPLDVTTGMGGRLLVLTVRGVTVYDGALAPSTDSSRSAGIAFGSARVVQGPTGELFVAGRTRSRMTNMMESFSRGKLKMIPQAKTDTSATKPTPPRFDSIVESMFGHAFISVYRVGERGDTAPLRTIAGAHANLGQVADLEVGRDGSLYVLCGGGAGNLRIAVFAPGAGGDVAPVRVIEGPETGLKGATSLALGRDGYIYVANDRYLEDPVFGSATITVYPSDAAGNAAPIRTIAGWSTRLSRPRGLAVADDGTIYVANLDVYDDDRGSVLTFAAEASDGDQPERTLMGRATAFAGPQGVVMDRADTLYVISRQLTRVTVYRPPAGGSAAPVRTIEGPETELRGARSFPPGLPSQLAIDRAGYLYVSDPGEASGLNAYGPDLGAVRIYRPGAKGDDAPVRTIIGGYTKLNGPGGVAIDRRGNVYVPNRYGTGPGSITVYGPDSDGDVHPVRMIAGPATALHAPVAVALGPRDTLYVVNAASVTVYAPGAKENASPVRTIEAQ